MRIVIYLRVFATLVILVSCIPFGLFFPNRIRSVLIWTATHVMPRSFRATEYFDQSLRLIDQRAHIKNEKFEIDELKCAARETLEMYNDLIDQLVRMEDFQCAAEFRDKRNKFVEDFQAFL